MNTTNLKFFTGCAAGLALLCSITLCGCSGAENDISALECFAGSCEGEDEENNDDKITKTSMAKIPTMDGIRTTKTATTTVL